MIVKARLSASWVLGCQAFVWLPAMAQNTLTVPMEIVRISNPELAPVSRGSATLYRIHPQYTIQSVDGPSRTELGLGAMIERSSNTDLSANRTLPSVRVLWESSSPLTTYRLRASLEDASTRETEFADFGRVTRDSRQRTGTLGGTWIRDLSAGSALELGASYARVSFDTPVLIPYSETSGSVTYRFESNPNARYSLMTSLSHLNPDGVGANASRGGLSLGYETDLSERFTLNAMGGVVYTDLPRRRTGPVGGLRVTYRGERAGYVVGWSRDVSAGGSLGGYTRFENVDASVTYPLSINTSLSVGASHARSLETTRDAGTSAYARVRTELSRFWAFTAGLEHRRARSAGGPVGQGNSLAVGFVYTHPDF
jgi:hypothetical protein